MIDMMEQSKITILMIDDDQDFREILGTKLRQAGYEVTEADSGRSGIEKLKEHKPDLVLLDLQMPTMSGMATLSAIRSDPELKDTRVMFLTNFGELSASDVWLDEKFAKDIGAEGYLRKSDDLDLILRQIAGMLAAST